jgi:protein-tyrosine phosphatase
MSAFIAGTYNSRDTGGLPLTGGGTTRHGVLYRSDGLGAVTDDGLATLAASPIGVIVDFRTDGERLTTPDRVPSSRPFRIVELSLLEGAMAGPSETDRLAAEADMANALRHVPTLPELYTGMLHHAASSFAQVARLIARPQTPEHPAVLVHCTAGKDRTGVATALLLDAVGVEREAIAADYTVTAANLAGEWADRMLERAKAEGVPLIPAVTDLIASSPRSAIDTVFAWLDDHGGSAAYLRTGGLDDDDLVALRERLAG